MSQQFPVLSIHKVKRLQKPPHRAAIVLGQGWDTKCSFMCTANKQPRASDQHPGFFWVFCKQFVERWHFNKLHPFPKAAVLSQHKLLSRESRQKLRQCEESPKKSSAPLLKKICLLQPHAKRLSFNREIHIQRSSKELPLSKDSHTMLLFQNSTQCSASELVLLKGYRHQSALKAVLLRIFWLRTQEVQGLGFLFCFAFFQYARNRKTKCSMTKIQCC